MRAFSLLLVAAMIAVVTPGCGKRREHTEPQVFGDKEREYVLTIVLDMSGSFTNLMAYDGKAYQFAVAVVDRYFRDRIGSQDILIIAQVSGTDRSLLWEGRPSELRKEFPSPEKFRDFLLENADSSASLIHEGMVQSIRYMMNDDCVKTGKAKSAMFVLSDMLDTQDKGGDVNPELAQALADFGGCGGMMAVYYCDSRLVPVWQQRLSDAGINHYRVESEIVRTPVLPSFD